MTKLVLDIETTGLNFLKDTILCVGFSDGTYIQPYNAEAVRDKIKGRDVAMQNCAFDLKFLWQNGVPEARCQFDTLIAAYLLTDRPNKLSLDSLASYYLGLPSHKDDIKSGAVFEDPELLKLYCLKDCELTNQLVTVLSEKLKEEGKLDFFERLMSIRQILTESEFRGVAFDATTANKLVAELTARANTLEAELHADTKQLLLAAQVSAPKLKQFNFNSPKQVLGMLKALNCDTINPVTKKESSDILVLELNGHKSPIVAKIVELRKTLKKRSTLEGYIESALRDGGALHTNFNMTNTSTGRLSSSGNLNIQQVERSADVRALFQARPGNKLVIGDLAQIEARMAAHYSKDSTLIQMFMKNEDLYGTIACQILGTPCSPNEVKKLYPEKRALGKVIGLSVLYGIGSNKLANMIKKDKHSGLPDFSAKDAYPIIQEYFNKFPGLKELQKGVHKRISQTGHITNFYGRKVDISEEDIFMKGVNGLLQSTASDYMLFNTQKVTHNCPYNAKLLMLVHDEAVFEVPEQEARDFATYLEAQMSTKDTFRIPIKFECSIGDNWAAKS